MKCFIKSLLGLKLPEQEDGVACEPLPPIVKSVIGGVVFLSFMMVFLCSTSS